MPPPSLLQFPVDKSPSPLRRIGGRANLASCFVAATFLILAVSALAIVLFVVFRPRDPRIAVSGVQIPGGFSAADNGTVTFTFVQSAAIRNPNRDALSHYDSSLQLVYSGSQIGFMFIPAGEIGGGRTQYMSASFSVNGFPLSPAERGNGGEVEMQSLLRLKGRVRVLRFLTHHVESIASCLVMVSAANLSVARFQC